MLVEALVAGSVISMFGKLDKSSKMDKEALQQYAEAYEMEALAKQEVQKKSLETDKRLNNVVRKKRNVIENSLPEFVSMYDVIQKVIIKSDLSIIPEVPQKLEMSSLNKTITAKSLSNKELVTMWFCHGFMRTLGDSAVKESERYLSASDNQMDYSRVCKAQSNSIIEFYDSIIKQADLLSDTIVKMNFLLMNIMPQIKDIINKHQGNDNNFSKDEMEKMVVCVNIVCALIDLVGVPVVDTDGALYEEGVKMIAVGQKKLRQMEKLVNAL